MNHKKQTSQPEEWRFDANGKIVDKEGNQTPDVEITTSLVSAWLKNHDEAYGTEGDFKPTSVNDLLVVKIGGEKYSLCPTCYYYNVYNRIQHEIVGTTEGICMNDLVDFLLDHQLEALITPQLKRLKELFYD